MPSPPVRRTPRPLTLAAAALLLLACARRAPPDAEQRDERRDERRLATPSAFDLIETPGGGALFWAQSAPPALHLVAFDGAARASSDRRLGLEVGGDVAELVAVSVGPARVLAWTEAAAEGRRLRAAWLAESGVARGFDLGAAAPELPGARGGLALAAHGQGARLLARGGATECTTPSEPRCRAVQLFAIEADAARPIGVPLAVPSPCAAQAAQLAPGHGGPAPAERFEYAVCSSARGVPALTVFSIQPSPAYAAAQEVFEGCTPLGAARFGGQSAFVAACGGERRLARLEGDALQVESLEPRGLVCGPAGANVRLGAGWLRLVEPLGALELLLGDDLAPAGARVVWTGGALLVARSTAAGELVLRRHACQGSALVDVEDGPDASPAEAR